MFRNKKKFRTRTVIAIVLVVMTAVLTATTVFANNQYLYVEEITMATGTNEAEVKKQLTDAGYIVAQKNLCDGNGQYAYLGYKTTDKVEDAITDIRLMNMNSGFKMMDYRALQSAYNIQLNSMAKQFMATVKEMKQNVAKNSPLAIAGKELLDLFYFKTSDDKHIPLSDYLFDESRILQDFIDINMISNTQTLSIVFSALNLGVDDGRLVDVGTKFSNYDVITQDDGNSYASLDKLYSDYAKILSDEIVQFNESYKKGAVNLQEAPKTTSVSSDEEIKDLYSDGVNLAYNADFSEENESAIKTSDRQDSDIPLYEAITEQSESELVENDNNYILFVSLYELMKDYPVPDELDGTAYGNPQNLGDYLIGYADAVKDKTELSQKDLRYLYPLIASFTEGQRYVVKLNGIISMMYYLVDPSEKMDLKLNIEEKLREDYLPELKKIQDENITDENNRVNIFIGSNVDAYNKQVALTEACNRAAASNALYEKIIVGESNIMKTVKKAFTIAGICALASAGAMVLGLVGLYIACGSASLYTALTFIVIGSSWLVGSAASVAGLICAVFSVVAAVVVVLAIIAFAIFAIWKWILGKDKDDKENTPATYLTIPEEVYDYANNDDEYRFIGYEAVTDPSGKIADINNYKSVNARSQWDVFYFTKDTNAGSPIIVEKLHPESLFMFSDVKFSEEKVMPLCRFGEKFATNVRNYQNKTTNNTLYIFFKTEKSVDSEEGGSVEKQGVYLQTLKVYSSSDSDAAKLYLVNNQYEVIEKNLTPDTGKYTYIGFTTTDSVSMAIKDIRVAYGPTDTGNSFQFGSYTYGCAGATPNNIALYYSCVEGSGTPIYADLAVTENKDPEKDNYEPVNLFSGGDAFDFCVQNGLKKEKWNSHIYIYFNPTEKFDSNSILTKKYVDGFAFFITDSTSQNEVESLMELNGFETFKVKTSSGSYYSSQKEMCKGATSSGSTYMAISKTANPYRAITDIGTYEGAQSSKTLFENLQVSGSGYSVCETFMQYSGKRSIRECNAYVCGENGENGPNYYPEKITDAAYLTKRVINEEGEFDDLIYKGVYVQGPCSGAEPLEPDDILFSENSNKVSGYRAVTNLYDGYGTEAKNLVYEYKSPSYTYFTPIRQTIPSLTRYTAQKCTFSHHLYIHIKGDQVKKGKYVSDIFVSTFDNEYSKGANDDTERFTDDYAITSALSRFGKCEISRQNIAVADDKQSYKKTSSGVIGADYYGRSSYICVRYTDNINEALRCIVMKKASDFNSTVPLTLSINKVEFAKCGDVISASGDYYYLYQSKNAFYGNPITEIKADSVSLDNKYVPILSEDGTGSNVGNYYLKYLRYTVKAGDSISESPRYFNKLNFAVADNKTDALKALLQSGCTNYIDYNRNASAGGKNIYFGYSTTADASDQSIITSIYCSPNQGSAGSQRKYNCLTYTCVSDYSLGAGGSYLYVSTDKSANPISAISLLDGDKSFNGGTHSENYFLDTASFDSDNQNGFRIRYYPSNYWSYKKGLLTIRCYGNMPDYNDSYPAPWSKYASSITDVVIESLVTSIDAQAFAGCTAIKTVKIENDPGLNSIYPDITIEDGAIPSGATVTANVNSKGITDYLSRNSGVNNNVLYYNITGTCHNSNFTFELNGNKLTIKGSGVLGDDSYVTERKKVYYDGGTGYRYINQTTKKHKYAYASYTPWGEALTSKISGIDLSDYFKNITELEIEGNTTSIASDFFKSLSSLKKITVKSISGTGFSGALGSLSNVSCYGYLDSVFRQYCIDNGAAFTHISSQSTPETAKKTAEQWEISGNTLIISKSGTYKNKGSDDCHTNSEYVIDKSSIKRVLLLNTVKALPYDAFNGYTNLKEVAVVSDVDKMTSTDANGNAFVAPITAIPDRCFKDCKALSAYTISSKITSIGNEAFSGCSSLSGVSIPSSVKTVGANCFNGCSSIDSIVLSKTVTSIGNGAFVGCKDGFTLTVNNPACSISPESVIVDKTATVIAQKNSTAYALAMKAGCVFSALNSSESVNWSLNSNGKLTVSAKGSVEKNWSNLINFITEVEFTSGVTSIPEGALSKYPNLKKVTFPSTLKEIPKSVCEECKELTTVVIPNGIEKIGDSAFKNCSKLDLIGDENRSTNAVAYAFPDSIKEIGNYAFNGIYDAEGTVSGIALPFKLEKIGERAICFKNTFVTAYNDDCEYGEMAIVAKTFHFRYSTESNTYKYYTESFDRIKSEYGFNMYQTTISGFNIDGKTLHITDGFLQAYVDNSLAPWNRVSAENIIFEGLIIIPNGAFKSNYTLKTLTFKSTEGSGKIRYVIPQDCFRDCTNLTTIKTENASIVKYGLSSFMNCSSLSFGHTLPDGAEYIDNFAFDKCEKLFTDYAVLPETLTYIGSSAFSSGNTLTISLPRSLEKICNIGIYSPNWTVLLNSPTCNLVYRSIVAKAIYSPEYENAVAYYNRMKTGSLSGSSTTMQMNYIAGWSFDSGVLTISGKHDMYDYPNSELVPWNSLKDSIDSVVIEDGVTSIGSYALGDLSKLKSISIPSSVSKIGAYSMNNLPLGSISLFGENISVPNNKIFGDDKTGSVTVKCIENSETYNSLKLLGYTVDIIKNETYFMKDIGILNISYCDSDSQASWRSMASSITEVVLSDSITEIPAKAFADFTNLTKVTLPSAIRTIPNEAFKNCTALKSVTIPSSVTRIGDSAFENCTSLNLCDKNGGYAFANGIKFIGQKAFGGVMENTECCISLPSSLEKLGKYAFCMKNAEYYINSISTEFGENSLICAQVYAPFDSTVFDYLFDLDELIVCRYSTSWKYEDKTLTISGNFDMPDYMNISAVPWQEYADEIENIVVEEGVRTLGDYAFNSMPNLKSISLPSTITYIGKMSLCNLGNVDTIHLTSDNIEDIDSNMTGDNKTAIRFTNANYSSVTWKTLSSNGYNISYAATAVSTIFANNTGYVLVIALVTLAAAISAAVIIRHRRNKRKGVKV